MTNSYPEPATARLQRNTVFAVGLSIVIGAALVVRVLTIRFALPRLPDSNGCRSQFPYPTRGGGFPDADRPAKHTSVFIGVLSHPQNVKRRANVRQNCFPLLRDEARKRGLHVDMKFVMGRAAQNGYHRDSKIQGRHAPAEIVALGQTLLAEDTINGDILPVAMVEQYIDIMDKTIAVFRHGLQVGAQLIAKVDDDTCGNVTGAVWDRWKTLDRPSYYYFGVYQWKGTEYKNMYGVDNMTAPYMSGPCYGLSRNLSQLIFEREYLRTTQHHVYSSSSEDATVGRLVQFVEMKYLHPRNQSVMFDEQQRVKVPFETPEDQRVFNSAEIYDAAAAHQAHVTPSSTTSSSYALSLYAPSPPAPPSPSPASSALGSLCAIHLPSLANATTSQAASVLNHLDQYMSVAPQSNLILHILQG